MRRWSPQERQVVVRGLLGRLAIAVEPAIIALLFGVFTSALWRMGVDGTPAHAGLELLAPIFGLGAAAFTVYAIYLLRAPLRALRETYEPIFVVDGFLRTRSRDDLSERGYNGYVAVLLEDGKVACEWPTMGDGDLAPLQRPAMLEFSEFGGIHRIDGTPTGVLPQSMQNIGVGSNKPPPP
ncbi:MAG TPA: hypothetical protein VEJ41_08105 [Candidatus Acidoferrales bacterium]|nr:hypothetical protein [Candidatus Acidoferrales bacterium]